MNSYYTSWLETEKEWIGQYKKIILRKNFSQTMPAIIIVLGILFGIIGLMSGGVENALMGLFGGLVSGIFISAFYLLHLFMGLRTGKYLNIIKDSVKILNMDEEEKEQLGHEMLEVETNLWRKISFEMSGPGSNQTPAQFKVTPHYAFLEGGAPYAILIRLSDVVRIEPSEEEKTTVVRRGGRKQLQKFTLYTIGFYYGSGAEEKKLPDQAMGFFSRDIRDQSLVLFEKNKECLELSL